MKIKGLLELSVSIFQKNDSGLPRVIYKSSTGQLELLGNSDHKGRKNRRL